MNSADRIKRLLTDDDSGVAKTTSQKRTSPDTATPAKTTISPSQPVKSQVVQLYLPKQTSAYQQIYTFIQEAAENAHPGTVPVPFTRLLREFLVDCDDEIAPILEKYLRSMK